MRSLRRISAFTLVEVAIALGIGGFALTALIGLLSVGLSSSAASLNDTLISTMANSVISEMRAQHFADNTPKNPPGDLTPLHAETDANVLPGTADVPAGALPEAVSPGLQYYFDASGTRLKYKTGVNAGADMTRTDALAAGAIYQCTATLQGDPDTLGATGSDGSDATREVTLMNVMLKFEWPAQAATPPNRSLVNASVARH